MPTPMVCTTRKEDEEINYILQREKEHDRSIDILNH
jgi:hypothetical protein